MGDREGWVVVPTVVTSLVQLVNLRACLRAVSCSVERRRVLSVAIARLNCSDAVRRCRS